MDKSALTVAQAAFRKALTPLEVPEPLTLSQWADRHFYLSGESSYVEGRWETLPYQRGIMNAMSNDDIRIVTWMKSARTGYTKCMVAAIGYFAEHKKRNQVVFQPVDQDAEDFSKDEIDPMLRDCPTVQAIFPDFNRKSKNNTLGKKAMIGSTLDIRGGKAGKNYRRLTKDIAYYDETDGFDRDVEKEGTPFKLGDKRVEGATFPKSIRGSTPKTKGLSLIEDSANGADCFLRFHLPCPACGAMQYLKLGQMKCQDKRPETVHYECERCESPIDNSALYVMLEAGVWMDAKRGIWLDERDPVVQQYRDGAGKALSTPRHVAFHLWSAYSPMVTWEEIMREYFDAIGDPIKMKTFVNTTLGETFEEQGEAADPDALWLRCEAYPAQVPNEVILLTAGVDVQTESISPRLELSIYGWGMGEESWLIDHLILYGNPYGAEVWNDLDEALAFEYVHESGISMQVAFTLIDSGDGNITTTVYDYTRPRRLRNIYSSKGKGGDGTPLLPIKPSKAPNGTLFWVIGVDEAKAIWLSRLNAKIDSGPGFMHFPAHHSAVGKEFFDQLTGEQRIKERGRYIWKPKRKRVEALDCGILSFAGMRLKLRLLGGDPRTALARLARQLDIQVNQQRLPAQLRQASIHRPRGRGVRGRR